MRKNTPKRSCSILPKWKKGVKTAAHMYHPSHREYPPPPPPPPPHPPTPEPTNLQLGPVQGDCEKWSGLFVWLTIMMQAVIHEKANQILTLIWIWRVILISDLAVFSDMLYIWITIYFFSIQQTCAPFPGTKHNVPQCSLMADSL